MSDSARMALEGRVAPPMENGELVFEEPWQGRVFGMAHSLCQAGCYEWDDFRESLIATVSAWDQSHEATADYHYYDLFLSALTELLVSRGICNESDLNSRIVAIDERPHGHDH